MTEIVNKSLHMAEIQQDMLTDHPSLRRQNEKIMFNIDNLFFHSPNCHFDQAENGRIDRYLHSILNS